MRTRHSLFRRIPHAAINLMAALGVPAVVATTGLHAGPIFFKAVAEAGIGLVLGGAVVTMTAMVVGVIGG